MEKYSDGKRFTWLRLKESDTHGNFKKDVRDGLMSDPKFLDSSCFYDYKGSSIFEEICELPEYYLRRTEIEILGQRMDEIISEISEEAIIAELGNGSSVKVKFFWILFSKGRRISVMLP